MLNKSIGSVRFKRWAIVAIVAVSAVVGFAEFSASAQMTNSANSVLPNRAHPKPGKPAWNELTSDQKTALAPLQTEWNQIDERHKRKWLEISRRFHKMSPDEQTRLHERMRGWVRLSPEARQQARENFRKSKEIPIEKRQQAWENYKQLTDEERQRLVDQAAKRVAKTNKKNLAPAPLAQPKMNGPAPIHTAKQQPEIPAPAPQPIIAPESMPSAVEIDASQASH